MAKIVAGGHAYPCFCTKDELEDRRKQATEAGRPPMYDRRCRQIQPLKLPRLVSPSVKPAAIRFAVPECGAGGTTTTSFDDAVFGKVEFQNAEIEDFVLLPLPPTESPPTTSASWPTTSICASPTSSAARTTSRIPPSRFCNIAPWARELPIFAHVPLILGPDKTRLSKRHGATSVIAYKQMGIVPEAFRNFLSLLGWTTAV